VRDVSVVLLAAATFAAAGAVLGGFPGLVAAGAVGVVLAVGAVALRVRVLVAVPVLVATAGGALAGGGVTHALCLPAACPRLEVLAAVLTGAGALVGVGIVVALVARSFDEYRAAVAADRPPPITGCGPDGACD